MSWVCRSKEDDSSSWPLLSTDDVLDNGKGLKMHRPQWSALFPL